MKIRKEDEKIKKIISETNLYEKNINQLIKCLQEGQKIINDTGDTLTQKQNLRITLNELITIAYSTATSITFSMIDYNTGNEIITGFKNIVEDSRKFISNTLQNPKRITPKELPNIMSISENHQTNSIKDTITGGKNNRIQNKTSKFQIDKYTKSLKVVMNGNKKDYTSTITLENFVDIKRFFTPNMAKFLDLIFYHVNNGCSSFTITEYLNYCGRKITIDTKKEASKEIKSYLEALFHMHLEGQSGKYTIMLIQPFSKIALQRGGVIEVNLDKDLEKALENNFFQMHKEVGKLSGTGYFIASFIYRHVRFKKAYKFNLSNETLYQYSGLPRYEEIGQKGEMSKLIIEPYHKAIAEIQKILIDKMILKQEEFNQGNWNDFIKAKINIEIPEFKSYVNELTLAKTQAIKRTVKRKKNKDKTKINNYI